jgi:hypothetical protein
VTTLVLLLALWAVLLAVFVAGCVAILLVEWGLERLSSHRLTTVQCQARAFSRRCVDDSENEPPDFTVPGDDFGIGELPHVRVRKGL